MLKITNSFGLACLLLCLDSLEAVTCTQRKVITCSSEALTGTQSNGGNHRIGDIWSGGMRVENTPLALALALASGLAPLCGI